MRKYTSTLKQHRIIMLWFDLNEQMDVWMDGCIDRSIDRSMNSCCDLTLYEQIHPLSHDLASCLSINSFIQDFMAQVDAPPCNVHVAASMHEK